MYVCTCVCLYVRINIQRGGTKEQEEKKKLRTQTELLIICVRLFVRSHNNFVRDRIGGREDKNKNVPRNTLIKSFVQ